MDPVPWRHTARVRRYGGQVLARGADRAGGGGRCGGGGGNGCCTARGLLISRAPTTLNPLLLFLIRASLCGGNENKHSTDVESSPPPAHPCVCLCIHPEGESCSDLDRVLGRNDPPRVCMSIHPEGKSCSDIIRVLVLNDPPARSAAGEGAVVGAYRCAFNIEKSAGPPAGALPAAGPGIYWLLRHRHSTCHEPSFVLKHMASYIQVSAGPLPTTSSTRNCTRID